MSKIVFFLLAVVFKWVSGTKCPDTFYYTDQEPFLMSPKEPPSKFLLNQFRLKKLPQQNAQQVSQPTGLIWDIIGKSYETCCLDAKLKSHPTYDDFIQFNEVFKLNQTTHGIFTFSLSHNDDLFRKVELFKSNSFYLIAKREQSGTSIITPIALEILISSWPIFLIILIANCYAALFVWFIDKSLKTNQLPKSFTKGYCFGLWWSFLVFSTTSLAPGINMRTCILKLFTIIWVLVSGVLICIFIAMFSTSLTMYALNGQSLSKKLIGIHKYAQQDKLWLEYENAIVIEYQSTAQMFSDLQAMKLDYVLLDQLVAANLYSKQIRENHFYLMRKVNREQVYSLAVNGFSLEQVSCLRSAVSLYARQWFKLNLSLVKPDHRLDSVYFNPTDELLYPRNNIILITAIVVLIMLGFCGLVWQTFNAENNNKKPNRLNSANTKALSSSSLMKKFKEANKRLKLFNERKDYNFSSAASQHKPITAQVNKKRMSTDSDFTSSLFNLNFTNMERSIHEQQQQHHQPVYRYLDSATNTDRSVKFNPLVHNIYFSEKSGQILDSNTSKF